MPKVHPKRRPPAKPPRIIKPHLANGPGIITAALLKAISDSGKSLNKISKGSGMPVASLSRFVRMERQIRLDRADMLATYFGVTITVTANTKSAPASKKK